MSDKELLFQLLDREIEGLLSALGPNFRMFAPMVSKYVQNFISPYVNAFMYDGTDEINSKAAGAYLKEETTNKIEEFVKKFNEAQGHNV